MILENAVTEDEHYIFSVTIYFIKINHVRTRTKPTDTEEEFGRRAT